MSLLARLSKLERRLPEPKVETEDPFADMTEEEFAMVCHLDDNKTLEALPELLATGQIVKWNMGYHVGKVLPGVDPQWVLDVSNCAVKRWCDEHIPTFRDRALHLEGDPEI